MSEHIKINSEYARELANKARSVSGNYLRAETDRFLEAIKEAAESGLYEYRTRCNLDPIIKTRLETQGFCVTEIDSFRNALETLISWKIGSSK